MAVAALVDIIPGRLALSSSLEEVSYGLFDIFKITET